jgi:ELWxxDGT repeat protein
MDIHPGPNNSGFQNPMSHAGNIYFTASDGTNGSEPWMSDGTIAGTQMIAETIPGPGSSGTSPSNYTAAGNLVFFRAGTSATGDELWATDGTVAGTGVVRDIWPGTNSSLPSNFIEHNGVFHFRAYPSSGNVYIYSSDGTQAGTVAEPLYGYTNPDNLVSHDGEIWFTAVGSGYRQLWHSDGTEAGTTEITYPGSDVISPFSNSGPMMSCNGTLFFRANYLNAVGQELYTLNTSTGIAEERTDNVRLYPNPVNDVLRVNGLPANGRVSLLTMDGRMVKNMVGGNALDTHDLPAGLYVARIHDANGRLVHHQPVIMVGN